MSPILLKRLSPPSTSKDRGLLVTETAKAGVLVFRERANKTEFLLLHRKKQNDWSFPKGHVELDESLLQAGLRETYEETGTRPMILGRLTDLLYMDGQGRPTRLALFLGHTDHETTTKKIHTEGETVEWVPLSKVERTLSYENLRIYFKESIKPLFTKRHSLTARAEILSSAEEPYNRGVNMLVRAFNAVGIRVVREELDRPTLEKNSFKEQHVSYFLSNHHHVPNAAFWLERQGRRVLNAEYLRHFHSKSQVQSLLEENNISIPPFHLQPPVGNRSAWILKSERHDNRDARVISSSAKKSLWGVYYERKVNKKKFTEIKLGYVAGKILVSDDQSLPPTMSLSLMHRIQDCLGLEIFSIDIFLNKHGQYYVIDVNPAPAFLHNEKARNAFAAYVKLIGTFDYS